MVPKWWCSQGWTSYLQTNVYCTACLLQYRGVIYYEERLLCDRNNHQSLKEQLENLFHNSIVANQSEVVTTGVTQCNQYPYVAVCSRDGSPHIQKCLHSKSHFHQFYNYTDRANQLSATLSHYKGTEVH